MALDDKEIIKKTIEFSLNGEYYSNVNSSKTQDKTVFLKGLSAKQFEFYFRLTY